MKMFTLLVSLWIISNICNYMLYIKYITEYGTTIRFIDTIIVWNIITICIILWLSADPDNIKERISWLLSFIK